MNFYKKYAAIFFDWFPSFCGSGENGERDGACNFHLPATNFFFSMHNELVLG